MEQLEATIKCGHCGNIGNCKVKASYTYDILVEAEGEYEQRMWFLFQCSACSRPILAESVLTNLEEFGKPPRVFEALCFYNGNAGSPVAAMLFDEFSDDNKILFPQDKVIENRWTLPYRVYQAYSAALRVQ
jgi:hypothetical protein